MQGAIQVLGFTFLPFTYKGKKWVQGGEGVKEECGKEGRRRPCVS